MARLLLDTNVIVRFLTGDHSAHSPRSRNSPIRAELQGNDRYRFWGKVDELGGRFLRVITPFR